MRKAAVAIPLLIILCSVFLLFGATPIEQATLRLSTDAATGRAGGIFLDQVGEELLVAYQAIDGSLLGRLNEDGWSTSRLPISNSAALQAFAAKGQLLVFAYVDGNQLYALSSLDGGKTFLSPARITPTNQSPSVQGLAIDDEGAIHLLFHRHDRFWDYNWAHSTNQGRTYSVRNQFTRLTDSNSTGYSGSLSSIHGRLYTIYQDTNKGNMIKLGFSENRGESWRITDLQRTTGGVLGFGVDPGDQDLLYVGSIDTEALRILKVTNSTRTPSSVLLYEDRAVRHSPARQASVHVGVSSEGEVLVVYLDPARSSYEVLVSQDGGEHWDRITFEVPIEAAPWRWGSSLKVFGTEPLFVRSDGAGHLLLQGVSTEGDEEPFDPDMDIYASLGILTIATPHQPFTITHNEEMKISTFTSEYDGSFELYHSDQDRLALTMTVTSFGEGDDEVLWNLDDDFNFTDRVALTLKKGAAYMLITSLFDAEDLGKRATLVVRPQSGALPLSPPPPQPQAPTLTRQLVQGAHVRAGHFSSFVIGKRGNLYATGLSDQGQLGQGSLSSLREFPAIMRYTADVAGGFAHTLMLGDDGRLWATGRNEDYQLGDGTNNRRTSPFVLTDKVVDMAGGYGHTLFVKKDGSLWAVGSNGSGQLGTGNTTSEQKPTKIMEDIVAVWTNRAHTSFALTSEGDLYGWGQNTDGQLGVGDLNNRTRPTYITSRVVSVAPGANFTQVLKEDGSLWVTGENSNRQLGTGKPGGETRLVKVADGVTAIAAGEYTGFYIDTSSRLWAAGSNQHGQWGNGTVKNTSATGGFVFVLDNVQDVAAGSRHAIVLRSDGTVWTAGSNTNSQLGDRSEGFRSSWKQVFTIVD
ncbi:MAG TPA: hypothetical protein PLX25_04495 [Sphaerochaeta sp.]|mgnify:CR=1 FL=1|nr:hypothetical protein [Sphaerochaeta sp.]